MTKLKVYATFGIQFKVRETTTFRMSVLADIMHDRPICNKMISCSGNILNRIGQGQWVIETQSETDTQRDRQREKNRAKYVTEHNRIKEERRGHEREKKPARYTVTRDT